MIKIEQQEEEFKPITITLGSVKDCRVLLNALVKAEACRPHHSPMPLLSRPEKDITLEIIRGLKPLLNKYSY